MDITMTEQDAPAQSALGEGEKKTGYLQGYTKCDAGCPARAMVALEIGEAGVLAFCSHHYNAYEAGLAGAGSKIAEDRRDILSVQLVSAAPAL